MVDFASRLVSTPSISGDERAVSELYIAEMQSLGYDRVERDEWGNVIGIIEGDPAGPWIMFNGHMDVVEAGDAKAWAPYTPFGGEIDMAEADRADGAGTEVTEVLHGRGSSDLKGAAAAQVYAGAALLRLRDEGLRLPGTFLVVQVAMEEYGEMFSMTKFLAESVPALGLRVDAMVCCEPSSLRLILGHRGRVEMKVTVHGRSCHGSSPWLGVNAMVKAARLIGAIEDEVAAHGGTDPDLGRAGISLTQLWVEPNALAIVPDRVTFILDRRTVPGETAETVTAQVQGVIDRLAAADDEMRAEVVVNEYERTAYTGRSDRIRSAKEPWKSSVDHPFSQACARGLALVGEPVEFGYWPFSTDVPAVTNGLGRPAIGYSGTQERTIHTTFEVARTDYLTRSVAGNAGIFLAAGDLPPEAFDGA